MIRKLIYIAFIFFTSCKSLSVYYDMHGEFRSVGKDYSYSLIMNEDSTFILKQQNLDVVEMCQGKWCYIAKDTILINCDTANTMEVLSSGYIIEREKKIIVINDKKIRIDQMILKKVKN